MDKVYFAGGCFWGTQHYFSRIHGVISTRTGFANGDTPDPTYREVYTDTTGYAETVEVEYDPSLVSLEFLAEMYFLSIDPLSPNRQGHDEGTRYRTGIYYECDEDLRILRRVYDSVQSRFTSKMAVELEPLRAFYPAEEYHQDYLDKNPGGYCHLPIELFALAAKPDKVCNYIQILKDFAALAEGEHEALPLMANACALLQERMGFFWTGFYLVNGEELLLGPFQGSVACMHIAYGKGVCGTAWKEGRTVIVPDVEEFPGHIACSALSRSEIVVPVKGQAVLDIDSTEKAAFDTVDAAYLERLCAMLPADAR